MLSEINKQFKNFFTPQNYPSQSNSFILLQYQNQVGADKFAPALVIQDFLNSDNQDDENSKIKVIFIACNQNYQHYQCVFKKLKSKQGSPLNLFNQIQKKERIVYIDLNGNNFNDPLTQKFPNTFTQAYPNKMITNRDEKNPTEILEVIRDQLKKEASNERFLIVWDGLFQLFDLNEISWRKILQFAEDLKLLQSQSIVNVVALFNVDILSGVLIQNEIAELQAKCFYQKIEQLSDYIIKFTANESGYSLDVHGQLQAIICQGTAGGYLQRKLLAQENQYSKKLKYKVLDNGIDIFDHFKF